MLSSIASTTYSVAAFGSFLVFLFNGRYRTLLDRVLRLRLSPLVSQVNREVSFEYLNRQLVWHAFTEFLLFLLPLVGISRWRRWLSRSWRKIKSLSPKKGSTGQEEPSSRGELGFLPERTCAICYQDQNPSPSSESEIIAATARAGGLSASAQTDITNPYQTIPCGCIYCYVCIATRLEAEDGTGWTCLRCGELVTRCRPWAGDVVEDTSIHPVRKQAGFENEEQVSEETFTKL
jgi:peroxin-2